ncbi:TPA: Gfo/Idh/MocA family oxidoreductase [bacterium]|nr:Gfo/Idh/MocA family oxidoreductase [bacterium]
MDKIRLAIVGCGVMGNRHLNGLIALHKSGFSNIELVSACDPIIENAEALAKRAEEFLGNKVKPVPKLSDLKSLGVNAIDITTVPWTHHNIAIEAMQMGINVMVEKPMGLTMKACKLMLDEAKRSGCVFSVAENFHYDPINIIGKELIKSGAIGNPRLMIQNNIGGGDSIIVTPWRHYKKGGGPLLDVGVHYSYIVEYLMGEVDSVHAHTRLHEKVRRNAQGEIKADAEDAVYATLLFKNGAVGQYVEDHAGHGQGLWQRSIYGSKGSINLPGDRSGKPINLIIDGKGMTKDDEMLELITDYHLNNITAKLFGGERICHYDLPFAEIDSGLLAIEYYDYAEAIQNGRTPSVDPIMATRSVALIYAMLESAKIGHAVSMDEIMNEEITGYQDEINDLCQW